MKKRCRKSRCCLSSILTIAVKSSAPCKEALPRRESDRLPRRIFLAQKHSSSGTDFDLSRFVSHGKSTADTHSSRPAICGHLQPRRIRSRLRSKRHTRERPVPAIWPNTREARHVNGGASSLGVLATIGLSAGRCRGRRRRRFFSCEAHKEKAPHGQRR